MTDGGAKWLRRICAFLKPCTPSAYLSAEKVDTI